MLTVEKLLEQISIGNSWLGLRPERIHSMRCLLTEVEEIGESAGLDFLQKLIGRFIFLTSDDFDSRIYEMAEYINVTFDLSTTIICAATANHEKDSGQKVLYDLCSALGLFGHTKIHTVNRYDHVQKPKFVPTDIILIDEFIGTGRSFLGRVRAMRAQYAAKNLIIPKMHGLAIAGMTHGLKEIAHDFESLGVCLSFTKGIQGMAPRNSLSEEYAMMARFENHLCSNIAGYGLPRLGDGACEALYSRSLGNCPNSVFPIFWWPQSLTGINRKPLFSRVL
jgi:hypothetical protein